jgi:hypothetical protein
MENQSIRELRGAEKPDPVLPNGFPKSSGFEEGPEPQGSQGSLGTVMNRLEVLSHRDPGGRGLSARVPMGSLGPAAFDLLAGRRIVIITGFCVRSSLTGETDGPPGALALASALRILGKRVVLVSDRYSLPLLRSGAKVQGAAFRTLELPADPGETESLLDGLVVSFKPTQVVAIERPGNAPDGHRYSMRGEILDDIAPGADRLFTQDSESRGYSTTAIGDGGNELGMGSLRDGYMDSVSLGSRIFCSSPADHALTAGISNWGAYALAAALSLLSGVLLLETVEREREVLSAMLGAGAVDGCTRQNSLSVDGLAWDEYSKTIIQIHEQTERALTDRRLPDGNGRTK